MKIEIRYFSKGGNTKKIAEAIGEELGITAMPISEKIKEDIDVLFLCNSVYAGGVASSIKDFIKTNDKQIATIYNVSSASILTSTYKQIKKLCFKSNLNLSDKEFHCKGSFNNKSATGHPDVNDLEAAKKFAKKVINK